MQARTPLSLKVCVVIQGPQPHAGVVVQPRPSSHGQPNRHLPILPTSDQFYLFMVYLSATTPEHRGDPAVLIVAVPGGLGHMSLVRTCSSSTTIGSYRWVEQAAVLQTSHHRWVEEQVCQLPYRRNPTQVSFSSSSPCFLAIDVFFECCHQFFIFTLSPFAL